MVSYFSGNQLFPLIISTVLITASIFFFQAGKKRTALTLLFLGSLGLGFFIGNLDHFLNLWDEQFHALVAKNLLSDPFKPTLYSNALLEYDYRNWSGNYIWLHKQPLFLWQIAVSLKLFGINELAVRIPSIVLHALTALMIYRIGRISCSERVGFYGAVFFSVSNYFLELIAGTYATDHNDVAFLFYITASIWVWFEYQNSHNKFWLILIGIFSGCAVLVKWLVGLLIFPVWAITLGVNDKKNWIQLKSYFPIALSFAVSFIVFVPWQLYIFSKFPVESMYEFQLNTEHFFKPIEAHGGNFLFHFIAIKHLYGSGDLIPFLLLLGLFFLLKNLISRIYTTAILSAVIITYGFYSIAATKMISFCIIVSPFVFLGYGALTNWIINFLKIKIKVAWFEFILRPLALLVTCFMLINLSKIQANHTDWKPKNNRNRIAEMNEMIFIEELKINLGKEKAVVFNTVERVNGNIPVMFYTHYLAYDFIPSQKQIEIARKNFYKIAILDTDNLPAFITDDDEIIKIKPQ